MFRLALVLFMVLGVTMAGIGVVVALSLGWYEVNAIVATATIGAVIAVPLSWMVARRLHTA
ncbi:MAG: hypothetical protein JJT95_15205 [Pararhodobacter sp.]|nr:hypothetical protein [Pararhodobacter sp.]